MVDRQGPGTQHHVYSCESCGIGGDLCDLSFQDTWRLRDGHAKDSWAATQDRSTNLEPGLRSPARGSMHDELGSQSLAIREDFQVRLH